MDSLSMEKAMLKNMVEKTGKPIDEQFEEEFFDLADNSNEVFSALQSIKWEK
jgi:hypothetical protein